MVVLVTLEERGGGGEVGVFCSISQRRLLTRAVLKNVTQSRVQADLRKFLMEGMVEVDWSCMTTVVDVAAACLT